MSERMSLVECEDKARDEGFDTATFDLCGPGGRKKCQWLDAYMGMFRMDGESGFVMTNDLKRMGFWCENFNANAAAEDMAWNASDGHGA
jgi:hypothetical protein